MVWETDGGELGDMLGVTLSPTLALVFGSDTGPSKKSKKSSRKEERRRSLLSRSLLRLKTFPVLPSGLQLFFIFLAAIVLSTSSSARAATVTANTAIRTDDRPIFVFLLSDRAMTSNGGFARLSSLCHCPFEVPRHSDQVPIGRGK